MTTVEQIEIGISDGYNIRNNIFAQLHTKGTQKYGFAYNN